MFFYFYFNIFQIKSLDRPDLLYNYIVEIISFIEKMIVTDKNKENREYATERKLLSAKFIEMLGNPRQPALSMRLMEQLAYLSSKNSRVKTWVVENEEQLVGYFIHAMETRCTCLHKRQEENKKKETFSEEDIAEDVSSIHVVDINYFQSH